MKQSRSFMHLILYDIRYSFRKNRIKWFFTVSIQLWLCIRSFQEVSFYGSYDYLSELWPVMSGASEYILSEDSAFQLPACWFLFQIFQFFLIGFYSESELNFGNGQALIRTHTREMWLASKFISVIVNIVSYYGCFLVVLLIGNTIHAGKVIPENGMIGLAGIPIFHKSIWEVWSAFIILPLLVSVTLGEIQVVLSLFLDPVISFMAVVGFMVISVFWMHPFLIGNFSMLYRQEWVSGKPEMSVDIGIILCFVLLIATFTFGIIMFRKKDILPAE
jgi:hypothetical protein